PRSSEAATSSTPQIVVESTIRFVADVEALHARRRLDVLADGVDVTAISKLEAPSASSVHAKSHKIGRVLAHLAEKGASCVAWSRRRIPMQQRPTDVRHARDRFGNASAGTFREPSRPLRATP